MTATRIIVAGILGGIAMFFWSYIAHDLLPLGEVDMHEIPNEQAVLPAMQANMDKAGLYRFPGLGLGDNPTSEAKKEAMNHANEKMAANPSGLIVYSPPGRQFNFGKLLGVEFANEVVQAILVVFLLAQTGIGGFAGRVGFVTVAGILAALSTNVSYWNWDGFPGGYTIAFMFIEVVGFICVGIIAALVLGKRAT